MVYTLLIMMIILMSGSVIGWAFPYALYLEAALVGYLLIQKIYNKKLIVKKNNILILGVIVIVFIINFVIISNVSLWEKKSIFLGFFAVFLCANDLTYESYTNKYINCIVFLASANLFFLILNLFGIQVMPSMVSYNSDAEYYMNLFYIYGTSWNGNTWITPASRNYGIFWEPGCYQAFLNLALFFFFQKVEGDWYKHKTKMLKFIVLIISIVTAFSTTGFFLLALNILIYFIPKLKRMSKKTFFLFVVGIVGIIFLMTSSAVVEKFESGSVSNESFVIRLNDQIGGIKAALYSPFWGLGYNSRLYVSVLNSYGITANSSGLLRIIQEFGIPFGVWYICMQCHSLIVYGRRRNVDLISKILYCVFLIILFSTEPIIYNPAFFVLVFVLETDIIDKNRTISRSLVENESYVLSKDDLMNKRYENAN